MAALGVVACVCLVLGQFSAGQDKTGGKDKGGKDGEHKHGKLSADQKALMALGAAYGLVQYGRDHKQPDIMIAAAKVIASIPTKPGETVKDKENKVGKAEKYDAKQAAHEILDEAAKMPEAKSDTIKKLLEQAKEDIDKAAKGPTVGPLSYKGVFFSPQNPYDIYFIQLQGGQMTYTDLTSHMGTDLDLEIRGPAGELICLKNSASPSEFCDFYVQNTGVYSFKCINFNPSAQGKYTLFVR